jgi:hypothetical protein
MATPAFNVSDTSTTSGTVYVSTTAQLWDTVNGIGRANETTVYEHFDDDSVRYFMTLTFGVLVLFGFYFGWKRYSGAKMTRTPGSRKFVRLSDI